MSKTTIAHEVTLEVIHCPNCGTSFGVVEHLLNSLRKNHGSFYCPSGHSMSYGESSQEREIAKLEKQLNQVKEDSSYWQSEANQKARDLQHTERRLSATKGVLTRTKNRISKGICPCCNRQFLNLKRHMDGKHPDYAAKGESNDD